MRKFIFLTVSALAVYSCSNEAKKDTQGQNYFGEEFKAENVIQSSQLKELALQGKATDVVVSGKVNTVCKKKGCWMTVPLADSQEMRVTFKDYGFFVPKDCDGKEVTFKGTATFDTTAVEMLQHYAEDEGKSKEEIDKITEPEVALVFEATGVIIK